MRNPEIPSTIEKWESLRRFFALKDNINAFSLKGDVPAHETIHFSAVASVWSNGNREAFDLGLYPDENGEKDLGKTLEEISHIDTFQIPNFINKLTSDKKQLNRSKTKLRSEGMPYLALGIGNRRSDGQKVILLFAAEGLPLQFAIDIIKGYAHEKQIGFN